MTAPASGEASPVEAAGLEVRYVEGQPDSGPHKPAMPSYFEVTRGRRRQVFQAVPFATALLSGDWLERVLAEADGHRLVPVEADCATCNRYRAQAAAIRAAAGVGL